MLRAEGIDKRFGGVVALRDVSVSVPDGEITGLMGPNGSGKSTLFDVLTGVVPADDGFAWLDNQLVDWSSVDAVYRQGIARTFQVPRFASRMTVLEHLLMAGPGQLGERLMPLFSPWRRRKVRKDLDDHLEACWGLVEALDLERVANDLANTLSGGQLKLLSLGMALRADSSVLLLDEPTAGVNPVLIERIERILRRRCEAGQVVFVIEHNMEVVRRLCHATYALDGGRIIAHGDPESVCRDPQVVGAYMGRSRQDRGADA